MRLVTFALLSFAAALLVACGASSKTASPSSTPATIAVTPTAIPATAVPLTPTAVPPAFEIHRIDTRPGVTMRFAFSNPPNAKAALIVFTGGDGTNAFNMPEGPSGPVHLTGNFAVRTTPDLVKQGYAAAILDVPSDQSKGMTAAFRISPSTAQDVAKVIDYLGTQGFQSIYLVGTSNGTLSAASVASMNHDARIKGIVLTSAVNADPRFPMIAVDKISVPTLVVYHHDDACVSSPPSGVPALVKRFTAPVTVVEASGGLPPQSDSCEAMAQHGYFGVEAPVIQAIVDWLAGKPVPPKVGS